jgi:hypothetical protein
MKTKTQLRIIIIICFILFQVIQVHAQFLDDPGGDPGYEDVPVDGVYRCLLLLELAMLQNKLAEQNNNAKSVVIVSLFNSNRLTTTLFFYWLKIKRQHSSHFFTPSPKATKQQICTFKIHSIRSD